MRSRDNNPRARPSESDLLLATAKEGDQQSLGELLQRSHKELLIQAKSLIPPALKMKFGASDLVQQTFEEAIRDFNQFQEGHAGEFRQWLSKLLENNARDATKRYAISQKRDVRRERRLLEQLSRLSVRAASARPEQSPESQLEHEEEIRQLLAAMDRLKPSYRAIIKWAYVEGLSCSEIAAQLNKTKGMNESEKTEGAVRMLRNRAFQQLKKELKKQP